MQIFSDKQIFGRKSRTAIYLSVYYVEQVEIRNNAIIDCKVDLNQDNCVHLRLISKK
jgi:hypothetical protein